ncbi:DNA-binding HRL18 [Babesia ovis]|uniref:DNA-binding HRL18 n=1 Tax=Babesia ovis TaxID=5869 RepID=A0A9W5WTL1_BABOV|nr:DNA-binding HRL18 [Babesia ovis]
MFSFSVFIYFALCIGGFVRVPSVVAHRSSGRNSLPSALDTTNSAFITNPTRSQASFGAENARASSAVDATPMGAEPETVTKKQIVAEIAQTLNMTQKDVGTVVDEFLKSIVKHMGENKEISIPKFGLFHNSMRGARVMKNLQTGEKFTAKPVNVPNLRFYEAVKNEVNGSPKRN